MCECRGSSCRAMLSQRSACGQPSRPDPVYTTSGSMLDCKAGTGFYCCVLSAAPDAGLHQVWDTLPGIESESPSNLVHFCIFQSTQGLIRHTLKAQRQTMMVLHPESVAVLPAMQASSRFFSIGTATVWFFGGLFPEKGSRLTSMHPLRSLPLPCGSQRIVLLGDPAFEFSTAGPESPRLRRGLPPMWMSRC